MDVNSNKMLVMWNVHYWDTENTLIRGSWNWEMRVSSFKSAIPIDDGNIDSIVISEEFPSIKKGF